MTYSPNKFHVDQVFTCDFCDLPNLPISLANFGVFNPLAGGFIVCCDECLLALMKYQPSRKVA